jgi:hypothetical protein
MRPFAQPTRESSFSEMLRAHPAAFAIPHQRLEPTVHPHFPVQRTQQPKHRPL